MDIETMPHAMYFSGNKETITKINQVPYQVIDYDDKGMFQGKLMDNTQVEIFIDNGATPSILPLKGLSYSYFSVFGILIFLYMFFLYTYTFQKSKIQMGEAPLFLIY